LRFRPGSLTWFSSFVALWLVVRGAAVLSLADVFLYAEELEKAAAAIAMLARSGIAHHQLAYHYYEGGGFVISHLDALAFLLVGPNLFAVKLVALSCGAAILVLGLMAVQRFFGARAAALFGFLYVFSPASFQKISLLALGVHYQGLFFVLLTLALGAALACPAQERTRPARTCFWLGLAAGMGTYFCYANAVSAAYVLAALLFLRPGLVRAHLAPLVLGLALGIAPLLGMASLVGREIFDIHGQSLFSLQPPAEQLARLGAFARSVLEDRSARTYVSFSLYALGLAALLVRLVISVSSRRCPLRFFALYLALFLCVYLASGFAVGEVYHYILLQRLSQVWLVSTVALAAVSSDLLGERKVGWRVLGRILAGGMVACGALDSVELLLRARPGTWRENLTVLLETKGYVYPQYFGKIERHLPGDREARARALMRMPGEPRELYPAIAYSVFLGTEGDLEDVYSLCKKLDPLNWREFLPGLGPELERRLGPTLEARLSALERCASEARPQLAEAIGRHGGGTHALLETLQQEIVELGELAPRADRSDVIPALFHGAGARLYEALGDRRKARYCDRAMTPLRADPEGRRAFLARQEAEWAHLLEEGFERARQIASIRPDP
jgi:hypothetical protein